MIPVILFIFFSFVLYRFIYGYVSYISTQDTKEKSDLIFVPGARSYVKGSYNPCLEARVNHAVDLYNQKYATLLLFSGGTDLEDGAIEAEIMKKMALDKGVPEKNILLEKKSTSTYENIAFSIPLLQEHDIHSLIIVTEPFHAARVSLVAKKFSLHHTISSAITSPCWKTGKMMSIHALKEPAAIILYKLQNKL